MPAHIHPSLQWSTWGCTGGRPCVHAFLLLGAFKGAVGGQSNTLDRATAALPVAPRSFEEELMGVGRDRRGSLLRSWPQTYPGLKGLSRTFPWPMRVA